MSNQNWSEIGSNISDMVQEAIDSEDFSKLSQAIQNTVSTAVSSAVNGAVSGVAQSMNEVGNSINRAADSITKRQPSHVPDYMKTKEKSTFVPQNPWKGNGRFEKRTADYMRVRDIPRNEIYSPGGSTRAGGYFLTILGGIGCFAFGMGTFVLALVSLTTGAHLTLPISILLPFLAFSIFAASRGAGVLGRFRRFKNYIKVLGNRTCITIKELAASVGKSEQFTLKDVRKMIERNMFLQGHLDINGRSLFVTHEGYEAYLTSQRQIEERKVQQLQQARTAKSGKSNKALPEDVKKLLADGNDYIEKIRRSNDAIQDETVSAKLDGLETVVSKILQYVEQHPESASETKKLMRYYLPTTIKLLESYQKLDAQPVQGENIQKSKREIESTLDTLNQAFARLFDNLYQDISVDISADISVLNTLLAQEGLTGEKINRK